MYFIISFLFSIIWSLLWFWYDHPFLFGLFGCLGVVAKKALVLGDEKALGQPNQARKQSKIKKEDNTEPQVLIVGAGAAGLAVCIPITSIHFQDGSFSAKRGSIIYCNRLLRCYW